jgi:Flp pilus assembly CpaF family ATPase
MQTRQPNLEGAGEIPLRRLVKEALRMRPSRIVVGEVRQEECLDLTHYSSTHTGPCEPDAQTRAITTEIDLPVAITTLSAGDVVVLYTDGVTEARRRTSEGAVDQFGEERLRELVPWAHGACAEDVVARVETSVTEFQACHVADDIGVLVLRSTGGT